MLEVRSSFSDVHPFLQELLVLCIAGSLPGTVCAIHFLTFAPVLYRNHLSHVLLRTVCAIHFLTFAQFCAEIAEKPYCRILERLSTVVRGCSTVFRSSGKELNNGGLIAGVFRSWPFQPSAVKQLKCNSSLNTKLITAESGPSQPVSHQFSREISVITMLFQLALTYFGFATL